MRDFADGNLDILVSTTVIEVGVNVPNATLMVVENADCFGMSQLHQLRGRVGRGSRQSFCVFYGADKGADARERLRTLVHTGDGFAIAQKDLEMRGAGDFFGTRQHGLPPLKLADLAGDARLLEQAQLAADALMARDPQLPNPLPCCASALCACLSSTERGALTKKNQSHDWFFCSHSFIGLTSTIMCLTFGKFVSMALCTICAVSCAFSSVSCASAAISTST